MYEKDKGGGNVAARQRQTNPSKALMREVRQYLDSISRTVEVTEQAAKVWGVAWMAVARQCRVEREKEVKGRGRIHAPGAGGDGPGRRGD